MPFFSQFSQFFQKLRGTEDSGTGSLLPEKNRVIRSPDNSQLGPCLRLACSSFMEKHRWNIFEQSRDFLTKWAERRCLLSLPKGGFLSVEMIEIMLARVIQTLANLDDPETLVRVLKAFFSAYTNWNFNECSVAQDCCRVSCISGAPPIASAIDDLEFMDSDCDNEDNGASVPKVSHQSNSDTNVAKDLSLTGDDNDEVHPRKRMRYELGQMRDVRRFYDVETTKFKRIAINPDQEPFPGVLDYLDSMSVIHPLSGENLAIRVLESHKKIILQEIARANNLLSDAIGDDVGVLLGEKSELLKQVQYRESTCYIVMEIVSESDTVRSEVSSTVEDFTWFLIQETQAFHGVLITPHPCQVTVDDSTVRIVVGIDFVSTDPYSCVKGATADFAGPICRVLLRSRSVIHERPDFSTDFHKRFHVKGYLTKTNPFR